MVHDVKLAEKYLDRIAFSARDKIIYASFIGLNQPRKTQKQLGMAYRLTSARISAICLKIRRRLLRVSKICEINDRMAAYYFATQRQEITGGYIHRPYRQRVKELDPETIQSGYGRFMRRRSKKKGIAE